MKLSEKLNKIDHDCIDNNKHFYDLRSMYESLAPVMTKHDKIVLNKIANTKNPKLIEKAMRDFERKHELKESTAKNKISEVRDFPEDEIVTVEYVGTSRIDEYPYSNIPDDVQKFMASHKKQKMSWTDPFHYAYFMDESLKESSKKDFIDAYSWACGGNKKEAQKAYKEFDPESRKELVYGFKGNAKKSFLTDSLHNTSWTATDIVRDLYNKFPKVAFLDERDVDDDRVALFFKFGGDVSGLEDLVKSYNCDYKISNGKMRIIAPEDGEYNESLHESFDSVKSDVESIEKFLDENKFYNWDLYGYEDYPMETSKIDFEVKGDWKHDHLYFKYLVKEWADKNHRNIFKIDDEEVGESDSDYYTAIYSVYITKDEDSFNKLNSMRGLFTEDVDHLVLTDYNFHEDGDYSVDAYYGRNYSGLEDSLTTNDYSEAKEFLWDKLNQGAYCEFKDWETGKEYRLDPDKIDDYYYEGEFDFGYSPFEESLHEDTISTSREERELEKILQDFGWEIEGKGKSLFGSTHYQIINKDTQVFTSEEFEDAVQQYVKPLVDAIDDALGSIVTWNFGANMDGYLTAGMDIHNRWLGESAKSQYKGHRFVKDKDNKGKTYYHIRDAKTGDDIGFADTPDDCEIIVDRHLKESFEDMVIKSGKVTVKKPFSIEEFNEDDGWVTFKIKPNTYEYRVLDFRGWKPRQLNVNGKWVDVMGSCEELEDLLNSKTESLKESYEEYKGYPIEYDFYGGGEYSVQYCGDDMIFDTKDEAKAFIDEIVANGDNPDWGISESWEDTLGTAGSIAGGAVAGLFDGPSPLLDVAGGAIGGAVGKTVGKKIDGLTERKK